MNAVAKVGIVASGYLAALLVASAAVALHMAITAEDSRGADGMYAFGDALLFLLVFGSVSMVPTIAAIYFVRTRKNARPKVVSS